MTGLHTTECSVCLCWDTESLFVGGWGYTVGQMQTRWCVLVITGRLCIVAPWVGTYQWAAQSGWRVVLHTVSMRCWQVYV